MDILPKIATSLMFFLVSGQQVRCDVIVDVIRAIDIETTTKELYLEDSPEQFLLRGLDDEGERLNIQIKHFSGL